MPIFYMMFYAHTFVPFCDIETCITLKDMKYFEHLMLSADVKCGLFLHRANPHPNYNLSPGLNQFAFVITYVFTIESVDQIPFS
jgi:hypothetical protein